MQQYAQLIQRTVDVWIRLPLHRARSTQSLGSLRKACPPQQRGLRAQPVCGEAPAPRAPRRLRMALWKTNPYHQCFVG